MKESVFYVPVQIPVQLVGEVYGFVAARMGTECDLEGYASVETTEAYLDELDPPVKPKGKRCSVVNAKGAQCLRKSAHAKRHAYEPTNETPIWS